MPVPETGQAFLPQNLLKRFVYCFYLSNFKYPDYSISCGFVQILTTMSTRKAQSTQRNNLWYWDFTEL